MRSWSSSLWSRKSWLPSPWGARPSLYRAGTEPIGIKPIVLLLVLGGVLVLHLYRRDIVRSDNAPATSGHADIVGKAWVIDGDTIDIAHTRIRLLGIDAPESAQSCTDAGNRYWPCGHVATRELKDRIAGQALACTSSGLDRYRRVLAVCRLPDGTDVNAWLVRQGWALAYGYSSPYGSEEASAQEAKRGIWIGTFMLPWEWRHRHDDRSRFD